MSKGTIIALTLVSIAIGASAYVVWRITALQSGFDQVARGDLREDVIRRLGAPSSTSGTCEGMSWLGAPAGEIECVREYRYDPILLPGSYTIGFDRGGRVVAKYEWISP